MARIRSIKPELPTRRWHPDDFYRPRGCIVLYRLFDSDGQLLYVGITSNPIERWRTHAQRKPWWPAVARIDWETYPKEHLALAAEREAIRSERPVYNVRSAVTA